MQKRVGNYQLLAEIGQGQFGKVYKGFDLALHRWVAVKTCSVKAVASNPKFREFLLNEVKTLQVADLKQHPHVITFYELVTTQNNYYLVYEYCNGGTLEQKVQLTPFDDHSALNLIAQLVNAFQCLHNKLIMHRDIKLENILLHNDNVRVADFGFCKQQSSEDQLNSTVVGSPTYMAPEVLAQLPYSMSAEIWSLGIVFYELLEGRPPFDQASVEKQRQVIAHHKTLQFQRPHHPLLKELISGMIQRNPRNRLNWRQISNHSVFTLDSTSAIKTTLQASPSAPRQLLNCLLSQRNRLLFVAQVATDVLELQLSDNYKNIAFLLLKFNHVQAQGMSVNLLSRFNPSFFVALRFKANWHLLAGDKHFEGFKQVLRREVQAVEAQLMAMREQVIPQQGTYYSLKNYLSTPSEMQGEYDDLSTLDPALYKRSLLDYASTVQKQAKGFPGESQEPGHRRTLLHLNKVLDLVRIEDHFGETLIDPPLAKQDYQVLLDGLANKYLLEMIGYKLARS